MHERNIEVGFGTLIRTKEDEGENVFVVVNPRRKGEYFSIAPLGETNEGEKHFMVVGSSIAEDVLEVIGKMSAEEVFKALEAGHRLEGIEVSRKLRREYMKCSRLKPRAFRTPDNI
jgi:hypothetical protein